MSRTILLNPKYPYQTNVPDTDACRYAHRNSIANPFLVLGDCGSEGSTAWTGATTPLSAASCCDTRYRWGSTRTDTNQPDYQRALMKEAVIEGKPYYDPWHSANNSPITDWGTVPPLMPPMSSENILTFINPENDFDYQINLKNRMHHKPPVPVPKANPVESFDPSVDYNPSWCVYQVNGLMKCYNK